MDRNGDGSYRVTDRFMKDYGNAFRETFGYDPTRAKVEFGWGVGSPAFTFGDRIIIEQSWWTEHGSSTSQGGMLVHELTHCVQFEQGGALAVMVRRAQNTVTHGPKGQYNVTSDLAGITDLKQLNVLDTRFTIESIAVHVENRMTLYRSGNGAQR